jgi:(E)-4-hydroxy-3-methylbut-2-enyl-diphosphate synthase
VLGAVPAVRALLVRLLRLLLLLLDRRRLWRLLLRSRCGVIAARGERHGRNRQGSRGERDGERRSLHTDLLWSLTCPRLVRGASGPGKRSLRLLSFWAVASERSVNVGGVQIGGGAPVVVQTMTKTETANLAATMDQIRKVADAGADIVRVAVPRDKDIEALKTIVVESPIPVIADIHFNHTLALKAIDAGAHCIRLNPGNIGGPEKVAEVADRARAAGTPMRIGVNSGSLPKHLHALERENSVEALVTAGVEFVELMERLNFTDFKVSIKSTNVPNTIAANRLLSQRIPYPLHLGITEAGTKWSGSLKSAVGLGTLLADGIGDTIRISLSTFHAEEEVKVAWEILKALKLRERGPVLIACPTCGRLQFDMDTVVADIERRLEAYEDAIEVAVLGCAVNGIGEASHADFGITGAKNEGLIFSRGKPLKKVPQERLVDELFLEIDKYAKTKKIVVDEGEQAAGAEWLQRIEEENAGELTPERLAKLEAETARADADAIDEALSPVDGRRFTRA